MVRKQGNYFKELQNKVKFSVISGWKILFHPFGHINISTPQYYTKEEKIMHILLKYIHMFSRYNFLLL